MNLRALVLALVLANAALFAWTAGWIDPWLGGRSRSERDPGRLAHQLRPETLRVLAPSGASAAMAGAVGATGTAGTARMAPAAPVAPAAAEAGCLEAGPYPAEQAAAAERLLAAALPAGSWVWQPAAPSTWLVYMGRYASEDTLARKGAELKRIGVAFEPVQGLPQFMPGLELGRYDSRAAAQAGLTGVVGRGVRTARIVALPEPPSRLRIEPADAALRARLAAIDAPVLGAPLGASFRACTAAEAR